MSSPPAWLEVALNGPWARTRQPCIPALADEIVDDALRCVDAGASIVFFHAHDPANGRQCDEFEACAPVIERIRPRADVICHPTLPFAGSVDAPAPLSAAQRFGAVQRLAAEGLIEWAVADPGSVNIAHLDDIAAGRDGFVCANPGSHVRHGLALAREHGFHPRTRSTSPASCASARRCTVPAPGRRCRSTG